MCTTAFVVPGQVIAYAAPTTGIQDVGRYPHGIDDTCVAVAAALRGATFASQPRSDIMRWKYRKLIVNTGNAVEALSGPAARAGPAGRLATDEAERVLSNAGIAVVTPEADAARRGDLLHPRPVQGAPRPGGSMWQSLARRVGSVEADHLNGEIVRIARHEGAHAPVNERLQQLCRRAALEGWRAGAMEADELLADLRVVAAQT
jgi:2-dehydropantoate 2-reductase